MAPRNDILIKKMAKAKCLCLKITKTENRNNLLNKNENFVPRSLLNGLSCIVECDLNTLLSCSLHRGQKIAKQPFFC